MLCYSLMCLLWNLFYIAFVTYGEEAERIKWLSRVKISDERDERTQDLEVCNPALYHWANVAMLAREHRERLVLIMKRMRQGSDDGRAEPVTSPGSGRTTSSSFRSFVLRINFYILIPIFNSFIVQSYSKLQRPFRVFASTIMATQRLWGLSKSLYLMILRRVIRRVK